MAGITLTPTVAEQWNDGTSDFFKIEVVLTNGTEAAVGNVFVGYGDAVMTQSWNSTEGDSDGTPALSFPQWLIDNGGLQPGATLAFGGVFNTGTPTFTVLKTA